MQNLLLRPAAADLSKLRRQSETPSGLLFGGAWREGAWLVLAPLALQHLLKIWGPILSDACEGSAPRRRAILIVT